MAKAASKKNVPVKNGKPSAKTTSAAKPGGDHPFVDFEKEADRATSKPVAAAGRVAADPGNLPPALRELFLDEIKDIYWAEKQLTKALPKMQQAAASEALAEAIEDHLEETKMHVTRLEQIFALLGEKAQAKKCDAMEGLTKEGESIVEDTEEGTPTRDAGIVMASQKIEHYEIATYGGLKQIAIVLQLDEVADLLAQTLEEEKAADEKLSQVADQLNFAETD